MIYFNLHYIGYLYRLFQIFIFLFLGYQLEFKYFLIKMILMRYKYFDYNLCSSFYLIMIDTINLLLIIVINGVNLINETIILAIIPMTLIIILVIKLFN
jgi:hypothetical protein